MRLPIVDGQFYESDSNNLIKEIENCFKSDLGPKEFPKKERKNKLTGVICPHAGYSYSGPCQAFSYKKIAEAEVPDLYILLGLSHNGFDSCISSENWETPLGIIETDKEFAKKLSTNAKIPIDEIPHQNEHSIEVQLPFLQYVNRNQHFKILPIIISQDVELTKFTKDLKRTLEETNKKAIFIASSDLIHYGGNYNYMPFKENIKNNLHKFDKDAINFIEKLDSKGFLEYIQHTGATICGFYPIIAFIEISKLLGSKRAELLKYYTSGDISGDYSLSVGYGSLQTK